jgi:hypothetical protein
VRGRAATEEDSPPRWELGVPYKRTKLEAEELVLAAARDGLEALCVNPTTPIGVGDDAPTPTGRMVRGVASDRCRATLRSGGLNLVDVRDVARGHVLALERGRVGERYILGGANLSLAEVFALIARAAGRRPPLIRLPYAAAQPLALVGLANAHEVALARLPAWFSPAKAERELGHEHAPIEPAVEHAVRAALRPVQARPQPLGRGRSTAQIRASRHGQPLSFRRHPGGASALGFRLQIGIITWCQESFGTPHDSEVVAETRHFRGRECDRGDVERDQALSDRRA